MKKTIKAKLISEKSLNKSSPKTKLFPKAKSSSKVDSSSFYSHSHSKNKSEKIVVTAALPYANGSIHIGHLLEYIQADVFVRFLKLTQKEAIYICASDMHGTPVEVNARKAGKEPEAFALGFWKEHQEDFASFQINFDNYYKTHSPENKELAEHFFSTLRKKGFIYIKKVNNIYCSNCQRYLPDRFVKGTCLNCTKVDQYGDVCEGCGSTLKGIDLINPKCSLCSKTPGQKKSSHYFFALSKCAEELKKWFAKPDIQPEIKNSVEEWLNKGLEDWCISRDAPYFGFEIPGSKEETGELKYFYVWLDAPIGYISSTENYCDKINIKNSSKNNPNPNYKNLVWEDYWKKGQVYHFIGKDIIYFHYLFWPAMLMKMDIPLPKLNTHGFITVNGQKMSKSRGTFFTARDFLKLYPAEALRFYYAGHLNKQLQDVDLNFEEFKAYNNNVLVGSLGNFCYRVLTFAEKNYSIIKEIAGNAEEKELEKKVSILRTEIEKNYQKLEFQSAVKNILKIADLGNAYFQKAEVWKDKDSLESRKKVGWCVNLARNLAILVSPVLPQFSERVMVALGEKGSGDKSEENLFWNDYSFKWKGKIGKVELLAQKIEVVPSGAVFPLRLAVGKIEEVKPHPNADSLYLMKVDFGLEGKRQVVAGLRKHFSVEDLLHRKAVFCLNMKLAKIRGETSEAMILAADDGQKVSVLEVNKTLLGEAVCFQGMENGREEVVFEDFLKLVMLVKEGKVYFEGKKLSSAVEDIAVHGLMEGARVR
ncbi:methionine--tRNA ligase [Candidatus Woesearchaeota archaeon]|nr:methionine--tRNA ligase [Candidatus Woesearchaeota archaeon]